MPEEQPVMSTTFCPVLAIAPVLVVIRKVVFFGGSIVSEIDSYVLRTVTVVQDERDTENS